ncbi:DUF1049 domain-containing protein [Pelistega sp. NLN82]|uniref:DUF1049 domain-containing protein n=1 Tax=Pelistega ratti TaxID=2652177 RepID=A0A6L9Y5V7_9BURK|nr:LapA family protein [Pelistega ratti]NEN75870.1 DUF1049 domain-containing protein [Pelistega ratti]
MHYVIWTLRLVFFVLIVLFAVKNVQAVDVNFFGSWSLTSIPLIIIILASFILGALYMYLLSLPTRFTRNREIKRLKNEVHILQKDLHDVQHTHPVTPSSVATPPDGFVPTKE